MPTHVRRVKQRNKITLEMARKAGFRGDVKIRRLDALVSETLIEAAKRSVHVESDLVLLEIALSRLAFEDDFGVSILKRKGKLQNAENLER